MNDGDKKQHRAEVICSVIAILFLACAFGAVLWKRYAEYHACMELGLSREFCSGVGEQ